MHRPAGWRTVSPGAKGVLVNARSSRRLLSVSLLLAVVLVLAACGSGTQTVSGTTTTRGGAGTSPNASIVKTLGQGVTDKTIKIGVALVDFKCIEAYVQQTRVDEYKVYQAFIDDINANGGIAGRKIVPVYKTFCPIVPAPALALCTSFTEDEHVFAVIGDFVDLTGQAQPCIANQHKTVLITFNLTQAIINSAPGGLMLTFNANQERRVAITLALLKKQHTLDGKTVAVLGEATTAKSVKEIIVPGLRRMGVKLGSTAVLTIAGADTTAASTQLSSFVEKWKTQGVDTVFLSGLQVSAQQFVPQLVKAMPGVQLIADNNTVGQYGQNLQKAGARPNPYEGIISTAGLSSKDYDQSANWNTCAAIYEKAFHKKAPDQETVVPGPRNHTLDISGSITDSCTELTMLHDIGERAGKYLNNANWINAVNSYGKINIMVAEYGSLHTGKYDADDTFALVKFDSKIPPEGDWSYLTPVEDVPGGQQ
jgi:ABC-type branched-subunit amino acid transport system substrate-binding protein